MSRLTALAAAVATLAATPAAAADAGDAPSGARPSPEAERDEGSGVAPEQPLSSSATYFNLLGAVALGRGVRFNNPFRLSTQLGDDGESLSLSATYADFSLGLALGSPNGLQHGGSVHLSVALDGITQEVLTPSYLALLRLTERWTLYARAGVPLILEPDFNAGAELALGGAWFFLSGTAVTTELVYDVFYGAATAEVSHTVIPILSLQAGLLFDYEGLP